jgi:hypothetical protein
MRNDAMIIIAAFNAQTVRSKGAKMDKKSSGVKALSCPRLNWREHDDSGTIHSQTDERGDEYEASHTANDFPRKQWQKY